jgi:hypothetical protein
LLVRFAWNSNRHGWLSFGQMRWKTRWRRIEFGWKVMSLNNHPIEILSKIINEVWLKIRERLMKTLENQIWELYVSFVTNNSRRKVLKTS